MGRREGERERIVTKAFERTSSYPVHSLSLSHKKRFYIISVLGEKGSQCVLVLG